MVWNLVGQERTVAYLQRCLAQGSLPQALLLVGPPHTGKGTLALSLAQALNCGAEDPPCGHCSTCRRIAEGKHSDVTVMSLGGAGEAPGDSGRKVIGVDIAREIIHSSALPPFEGRHRVFIIDGAENLSHEAANALLKTMEEPGPQVVLILIAVDEEAVLPTVRSRCQRLPLRAASVDAIARLLEAAYGVPQELAATLARESRGRTGWAVSAVRDPAVAADRLERRSAVQALLRAARAARFDWAAHQASEFGRRRLAVLETLDLAADVWHDVLLLHAGCAVDLVLSAQGREDLIDVAGRLTLPQIAGALRAVRSARVQLERNANPRLALETLMLSLPAVGADRRVA